MTTQSRLVTTLHHLRYHFQRHVPQTAYTFEQKQSEIMKKCLKKNWVSSGSKKRREDSLGVKKVTKRKKNKLNPMREREKRRRCIKSSVHHQSAFTCAQRVQRGCARQREIAILANDFSWYPLGNVGFPFSAFSRLPLRPSPFNPTIPHVYIPTLQPKTHLPLSFYLHLLHTRIRASNSTTLPPLACESFAYRGCIYPPPRPFDIMLVGIIDIFVLGPIYSVR